MEIILVLNAVKTCYSTQKKERVNLLNSKKVVITLFMTAPFQVIDGLR